MPYKTYYLKRSDGDWDLIAMVAGHDEIDNDVADTIKLGIDRAFGSLYKVFGEPMVIDFDDPEFAQIWSEDATMEPETPASFEEGSFLWRAWLDAIKIMGNYKDALSYIEETLTLPEHDELEHFSDWLSSNDFSIGHGNYYQRYRAYKEETK